MLCNFSGPLRSRVFDWSMVRIISMAAFCRTPGGSEQRFVTGRNVKERVIGYAKVVGFDGRRGRIWYLFRYLGVFGVRGLSGFLPLREDKARPRRGRA